MSLDEVDVPRYDGDDDPSFQDFRKEMQLKDKAKRFKAKEQFALKKLQRFSKQKEWRQQVKRTQQYLGLRTPRISMAGSMEGIWSHLEDLTVTVPAIKKDSGFPIHGALESLPNDFDSFVVFISVDVEAFEFNHKLITEIGVSTLDTVDLLGVLPGATGKNWAAKIRSRHFRIREHGHRLNRVHVEGCPDKFDFGKSEWIYEREAISVLEGCFNPSRLPLSMNSSRKCKVVLVAHDAAADMKYLAELGFDVTQMISDCIDTSDLNRAARRDARQSALSALLLQYGIAGKHLHNAGNDASYTLCAMIAIALDDFQNKKTSNEWEIEKQKRIETACEEARTKVCAEFEGWSSSENEDIADSSTLSLPSDRLQEQKTPGVTKGRYGSDAEPIMKHTNPHGPAYLPHIYGSLGDVAVERNPNFQEVSEGPFVPFYRTSTRGQSSKRDDQGQDQGRGQGRGRDRVQDSVSDKARGEGPGQGQGQGQGRGRGRGRGLGRGQGRSQGRGQGRGQG